MTETSVSDLVAEQRAYAIGYTAGVMAADGTAWREFTKTDEWADLRAYIIQIGAETDLTEGELRREVYRGFHVATE